MSEPVEHKEGGHLCAAPLAIVEAQSAESYCPIGAFPGCLRTRHSDSGYSAPKRGGRRGGRLPQVLASRAEQVLSDWIKQRISPRGGYGPPEDRRQITRHRDGRIRGDFHRKQSVATRSQSVAPAATPPAESRGIPSLPVHHSTESPPGPGPDHALSRPGPDVLAGRDGHPRQSGGIAPVVLGYGR